jgi:hypothetical protein
MFTKGIWIYSNSLWYKIFMKNTLLLIDVTYPIKSSDELKKNEWHRLSKVINCRRKDY